jgi:hypothetical protein
VSGGSCYELQPLWARRMSWHRAWRCGLGTQRYLPAVWFVAEIHESKIRIMIFSMFVPIALSFEAPIIKATSKDHPYWRALSGAKQDRVVRKRAQHHISGQIYVPTLQFPLSSSYLIRVNSPSQACALLSDWYVKTWSSKPVVVAFSQSAVIEIDLRCHFGDISGKPPVSASSMWIDINGSLSFLGAASP